ncbi:hypothetical protein E2C01_014015 [Portunus trituberculatus]|uniref:Uncharacterized protein n=1 Tax=Portunus trituberculatus TaxID=210409 RepID=A0A5B7DHP8_PORTR|nr:hypothetical protein [Portunus trituberculatus]
MEILHDSVRDGDEDTWLTTRRLYEPYTLPGYFFQSFFLPAVSLPRCPRYSLSPSPLLRSPGAPSSYSSERNIIRTNQASSFLLFKGTLISLVLLSHNLERSQRKAERHVIEKVFLLTSQDKAEHQSPACSRKSSENMGPLKAGSSAATAKQSPNKHLRAGPRSLPGDSV